MGEMLRKYIVAIRIYYGGFGATPYADLKMNDGVVETIEWTDAKQRAEFMPYMNGYTFIYDERRRASFEAIR
jgi:xanthine dehydrogenase iron-sulfur cluster and FAD-binding subunit A